MRTTTHKSFSTRAALLAGGLVALGGGCADNAVSFYIGGAMAQQLQGTFCTIVADPNGLRVTEGILDLALREDYVFTPLLRSEIFSRRRAGEGAADAQSIMVQGFIIEVHDSAPDGPAVGSPFTVYQTSILPAAVGATAFSVTTVQIVPPAISRLIRGSVCQEPPPLGSNCPVIPYVSRDRRLIARIKAFGQTVGGVSVETPPFDFPINVCCNCLLDFPPDSETAEMAHAGPDCLNGAPIPTNGICNPGQDFRLDCRFCSRSAQHVCNPRAYRVDPSRPCCTTSDDCRAGGRCVEERRMDGSATGQRRCEY